MSDAQDNVLDAEAIIEEATDIIEEFGGVNDLATAILGPSFDDNGEPSVVMASGRAMGTLIFEGQQHISEDVDALQRAMADTICCGATGFVFGLAIGVAVERHRAGQALSAAMGLS